MTQSLTRGVDEALRTLIYVKFGDILSINAGSGSDADKINMGVVLAPKEIALRELSEKRGKDYLEFINVWRVGTSPSWSRQRTILARRGLYLAPINANKKDAINIKAQPIDLSYNVWFWSRSLDLMYQCIERYVFWQQDYPKIDLTYTFDNTHTFDYSPDLHFGEIVDEGTYPDKYEKGNMFVFKVPIKIDAWVLDGSSLGNSIITKIILTTYDKDDVANYSEIIVPDSNQDTELEAQLRLSRTEMFGILAVSLANNSVTIPNDRRADLSVGNTVRIENSTANDETYTIVSLALVNSNTVVVLAGNTLVDDTADGDLQKISNP